MKTVQNTAMKFRLYPNRTQQKALQRNLKASRLHWNEQVAFQVSVRNAYLAGDKDAYKNNRRCVKMKDARLKIAETWPEINEADSTAGSYVLLNINAAMSSFLRVIKKGEYRAKRDKTTGEIIREKGFPRFKSVFDTTQSYSTIVKDHKQNYIKLPKIGWIKMRQHRPIPDEARCKTATISWTPTGKYYIAIVLEWDINPNNIPKPPKKYKQILGIVYDRERGYVDSEGRQCDKVDWLRELLPELAEAQQVLKRKDRGSIKENRQPSGSYNRQRIKVARLHEKAANRRKDYWHKKSRELADYYDAIAIQKVDLKNKAGRKKNGGDGEGIEVADIGFGMGMEMLKTKLDDRGKPFLEIKLENAETPEKTAKEVLALAKEKIKELKFETGKKRVRVSEPKYKKHKPTPGSPG